MPRQEIKIEPVVAGAEKCPRPPVAALSDMMRYTGNDNASQTSHDKASFRPSAAVN